MRLGSFCFRFMHNCRPKENNATFILKVPLKPDVRFLRSKHSFRCEAAAEFVLFLVIIPVNCSVHYVESKLYRNICFAVRSLLAANFETGFST